MSDIGRRYAPAQDIVLVTGYNIVPEVTHTDSGEAVAFLLLPLTGKVNGQDIDVSLQLALSSTGIPALIRALRGAWMSLPIQHR